MCRLLCRGIVLKRHDEKSDTRAGAQDSIDLRRHTDLVPLCRLGVRRLHREVRDAFRQMDRNGASGFCGCVNDKGGLF